ncbi:hypothetical protein B0H34DRAFT_733100 [Crassisporium funariophilum]|nr:hypothetical protein B0H34DRAFT_733100 [Crassisporium funariophilum]
MTEYDYSPDAIERHLAKQQQISRWVDQTHQHPPANPFVPLPGEHALSQVPQPAFYTNPQGVISPTYSNSRRHHHSQRPSPQTAYAALPQQPTLGYRPPPARSFSTPPSMMHSYSTPAAPQYVTYPSGYTVIQAPYTTHNTPYNSPPISQPSLYSRSSSHSHSHSHSRSHSHHAAASYPVQQQLGGMTYLQASPHQPVVIPTNGGYVVVPAAGQQVQVIVSTFSPGHL